MLARTVAALAAVSLLLAACSGDDEASPPSSTAPEAPSESAPTTATPTTPAPTTAPPTSTDPYAEWCAFAVEVEEAGDRGDDVDYTDPEAVRAYFGEFMPLYDQAEPIAPAEIADAVSTMTRFAERMEAALIEADYDMFVADLAFLDAEGPDRDAANDEIEQFNAEHCGIPIEPDDDPESDDFSFGDGTLREQFVERLTTQGFTEAEAECIFGEVDFSDLEALDDLDTMTAVFDTCGISLQRLSEINSAIAGNDMWAELRVVLDEGGVPADQIECVVDELGSSDIVTDDGAATRPVFRALVDCGVNVVTMGDIELPEVDDVAAEVRVGLLDFDVPEEAIDCILAEIDLSDIATAFEPDALGAALDLCLDEG